MNDSVIELKVLEFFVLGLGSAAVVLLWQIRQLLREHNQREHNRESHELAEWRSRPRAGSDS
jgi:hypothetical protein